MNLMSKKIVGTLQKIKDGIEKKRKNLLTHGLRITSPIEIMFMFFGQVMNASM